MIENLVMLCICKTHPGRPLFELVVFGQLNFLVFLLLTADFHNKSFVLYTDQQLTVLFQNLHIIRSRIQLRTTSRKTGRTVFQTGSWQSEKTTVSNKMAPECILVHPHFALRRGENNFCGTDAVGGDSC